MTSRGIKKKKRIWSLTHSLLVLYLIKLPLAVTMNITAMYWELGYGQTFKQSSSDKNFGCFWSCLIKCRPLWLAWSLSTAGGLYTSFSPWIFCPVPFCFSSLIWLFFLFGKWRRCSNKSVFSLISFPHPLPALQKYYPSSLQLTTEGAPWSKTVRRSGKKHHSESHKLFP